MKHFLGKSTVHGQRGISDYQIIPNGNDNRPNVMLRGTFTTEEIKDLYYAMISDKPDSFEFPETVK